MAVDEAGKQRAAGEGPHFVALIPGLPVIKLLVGVQALNGVFAPITLFFFRVDSYRGEPRNLIFREMRWEPAARLAGFDFVEGDREFIRGLATGVY